MINSAIKGSFDAMEKHGTKKGVARTAIAVGTVIVGVGALCWWKTRCKTNAKKETVTAECEVGIKKADNDTKNRVVLSKVNHGHKMEEIEKKEEEKRKTIYLREQLREERRKSGNLSVDSQEQKEEIIIPDYNEVIAGSSVDEKKMRCGLSYFHIGEDCGLVGMQDNGKSTFIKQYALSLAQGYCDRELDPEWYLEHPMTVILFAMEESSYKIKSNFKDDTKRLPNLHPIIGESNINRLKQMITEVINRPHTGNIVVIFDNYSKLAENNSEKNIMEFGKWLDNLRVEMERSMEPITYIKVFHTLKKHKATAPIELEDVRGHAGFTMFAQDFVALMPCNDGSDTRIIQELKQKWKEKRVGLVDVLRYAEPYNGIPMYEYVRGDTLANTLLQNTPTTSSAYAEAIPRKAGRPTVDSYTDDEILGIYDLHKPGERWDEIEEVFGITSGRLKTRYRRILEKRGIKPGKKS